MTRILELLCLALLLGATLAPPALPAPAEDPPPIVFLPFEGDFNEGLVALTLRALREAEALGADTVVLEIDSDGGNEALMSRLVRALEETDLITVAFVRREASNTAALVALACDRLYMSLGATLGTPPSKIPDDIELPEALRRQISEEQRYTYRAAAQRTGRNQAVAEAMVDPDLVLTLVTVDGVPRVVLEDEMRRLQAEYGTQRIRVDAVLCRKGETLNLTALDADEIAFIDGTLRTREDLLTVLEIADSPVVVIEPSWSEGLAMWVDSLMWILIAAGVIAIFVEIKAPGFGVPGVLGALCIALVLFGKYLAGLAEMTEILLIALGFVLIAIELFLFPGTLVAGILGVVVILGGILLALQSVAVPTGAPTWTAAEWWNNVEGLGWTLGAGILGMFVLAAFLPKVPVLNRVVLRGGAATSPGPGSATLVDDVFRAWTPTVGSLGTARSMLRPAGKIEVEGRLLDAVAEGEFVNEGGRVRIVKVEGNRIVVRSEGQGA